MASFPPTGRRRDAGAATLGNVIYLAGIVVFVCVIYLMMDVRHRIAGYDTVHGKGITGTVSVTHCESGNWRTYCVGDFKSQDGTVVRRNIRVNGAADLIQWRGGPLRGSADYPAAVSHARAGEAWTMDGAPWLEFSRAQVVALVPVGAALALVWKLLGGGFYGRGPLDRLTSRESARQRIMRRGRVY